MVVVAATEPLHIDWGTAMLSACCIAAIGALCDAVVTSEWDHKGLPSIAAVIILSSITAAAVFAMTRQYFDDSLQLTVLAGVCGIYGRRYLQPMSDFFMRRISNDNDRKDKSGGTKKTS